MALSTTYGQTSVFQTLSDNLWFFRYGLSLSSFHYTLLVAS